jgi:hypothetical protein
MFGHQPSLKNLWPSAVFKNVIGIQEIQEMAISRFERWQSAKFNGGNQPN